MWLLLLLHLLGLHLWQLLLLLLLLPVKLTRLRAMLLLMLCPCWGLARVAPLIVVPVLQVPTDMARRQPLE